MDKAKQDLSFKVEGLKQQVKTEDQLLEQLKGQLEEPEKARLKFAKKIFNLKDEVKYVEDQWAKSTSEIE